MRKDDVSLAKITRPGVACIYQRTNLYRLLNELSSAPLVMVSGKPGSGKTTLVAGYVEYRNMPCLWYRLDRGDEDLTVFFHYLTLAAIKVSPHKKAELPYMPPQRVIGISSRIRQYFRELFQCLETPFLIVLDDYHEVPAGALLHDTIRDACAELPQGGRIILISRNACPQNMTCVIADRTTAVITGEELRLSPGELKEIAALHGVMLSSDEAAQQLHEKVGGWAAELTLALDKEHQAPSTV